MFKVIIVTSLVTGIPDSGKNGFEAILACTISLSSIIRYSTGQLRFKTIFSLNQGQGRDPELTTLRFVINLSIFRPIDILNLFIVFHNFTLSSAPHKCPLKSTAGFVFVQRKLHANLSVHVLARTSK